MIATKFQAILAQAVLYWNWHSIHNGYETDADTLEIYYYAPRQMPDRFADVTARPGYVRIREEESRTSLNRVSILARKLTSVYARITTKWRTVPFI